MIDQCRPSSPCRRNSTQNESGFTHYDVAVSDVAGTPAFDSLVLQVDAVLLTRGLAIQEVAVRGVVAHMLEAAALRTGKDLAEALKLLSPEAVADQIAAAADPAVEGAQSVHSVRPVRIDLRTVQVSLSDLGHVLMALSQAAKYAIANGDTRTADHAVDLSTEVGMPMTAMSKSDFEVALPVGVLDETQTLLNKVAQHLEDEEWSSCPCGQVHGQRDLDAKVAPALRADSRRADRLRGRAG